MKMFKTVLQTVKTPEFYIISMLLLFLFGIIFLLVSIYDTQFVKKQDWNNWKKVEIYCPGNISFDALKYNNWSFVDKETHKPIHVSDTCSWREL